MEKAFEPGKTCSMLSKVKTYDNFYCIKEFKIFSIKKNKYEGLRQNDLYPTMKRNTSSDNMVTGFIYNVKSFSKHMDDLVSDDRIMNNDITGFAKINSSDSSCKITETLNFFNVDLK